MICIDAAGLAVEQVDMRSSTDRLLARAVQVFGSVRAHHGYLFAKYARPACKAPRPRRLRCLVRHAALEPGPLRVAGRDDRRAAPGAILMRSSWACRGSA
jgi:hypothetical protein